ncbi:MAG: hypothetical protein IJR71_09245 [Prevotella sp.]|nr:hypothetical protein [Prevotella sp.]
MRYDDKLYVTVTTEGGYDENLDPIEPSEEEVLFGKCFIGFNDKAESVTLHDGKEYIYRYSIIAALTKANYPLIPKEGAQIRFVKKDGTIDKTMTVQGFVTLKERYLKIWV